MNPQDAQALFDLVITRLVEAFSAGITLGLVLRVLKRS